MARTTRRTGSAGFTLVEVLVAITILLVGVVAVGSMLDVANGSVGGADARTGATAIARDVAEAARGVPARTLAASSNLTATLQAAATDLPTTSAGAWTVSRHGFTYTITTSVCTVDDASDGIGAAGSHTAAYCSNPAATTPSDTQPADLERVSVRVTWTPRAPASPVTQVTEVPFDAYAVLPAVTALSMTSPFSCSSSCSTITSGTSAAFQATTSLQPASISWLVGDNTVATCPPSGTTCSGSGTTWNFTWNLGSPVKDTISGDTNYGMCVAGSYVYDGTYSVGAQAASSSSATGQSASMGVQVNRCAPIPPPSMVATGRDTSTPWVDVDWQPNPEGDIVGYRVYKGTSSTSKTVVCPSDVSSGQVLPIDGAMSCTDPAPPCYGNGNKCPSPFFYAVVAVDRDSTGALREGAISYADVQTGNRAPNAPTAFSASTSAGVTTLTWTLPTTLDPDSGDTIGSFRVYRQPGTTTGTPSYTDRYDRESLQALCSGSVCTYKDSSTGGTLHTYWVTAVDTHDRESAFIGPKTA